MAVIFQEAGEALDQTLLGRTVAGRVISHDRQMSVLAAGQTADHSH
jgi:hypothetical protein